MSGVPVAAVMLDSLSVMAAVSGRCRCFVRTCFHRAFHRHHVPPAHVLTGVLGRDAQRRKDKNYNCGDRSLHNSSEPFLIPQVITYSDLIRD
jgi:hypothetical protein